MVSYKMNLGRFVLLSVPLCQRFRLVTVEAEMDVQSRNVSNFSPRKTFPEVFSCFLLHSHE